MEMEDFSRSSIATIERTTSRVLPLNFAII